MIQAEKRDLALYAIHRVFHEARLMAYEKADHCQIATFLDIAELLPKYVAAADDETPAFRTLLLDLSRERPHLCGVLRRFDGTDLPRW